MDSPRHNLLRLLALCVAMAVAAAVPAVASAAGPPPNDDFASAEDLGGGTVVTASGSNLWATAEAREPSHQGITPAAASVWYRWTAPRSGIVFVDTCGSSFDTTLAVYRGSTLDELGRVAANDDRCELQSSVRFFAVSGTTYGIAVDGLGGAQGSVELRVRSATAPPNDDFAAAADLGPGLLASATGTTLDASPEAREPNHAGRPAQASVWYRWTAPASRDMQLDTCGSNFDTLLAVYTGPDLRSLGALASNDDSCDVQSLVRFNAVAGTTYQIAVDTYGSQEASPESTRDLELALGASNAFHLNRLKRNTRRGTGTLFVSVANPGELRLAGGGLVAASARATAPGRVALRVAARGTAKRLLNERGSARVNARVTYTPEGGRPKTLRHVLVLVKRR